MASRTLARCYPVLAPTCTFFSSRRQLFTPQAGHVVKLDEFPVAFHRMPPMSHTERSCPHAQCATQDRESASMLRAQLSGKMAVRNFCRPDIR